jgi:hypothetical protein
MALKQFIELYKEGFRECFPYRQDPILAKIGAN